MTEEEMKKTWCPHMRIACVAEHGGKVGVEPDMTSFNMLGREGLVSKQSMCLGSKCSQWRWDASADRSVVQNGDGTTYEAHPDMIQKYGADKRVIRHLPRHGYCGLAGRP